MAVVTVTLSGPQVFLTTVKYAKADGNDLLNPERNAESGNRDYVPTAGRIQMSTYVTQ